MRVLFITNIPSPYRVQFFQELAVYCDLTVVYEKRKASNRNNKWENVILKKAYKEIYLKSVYEKADSAFCPEISRYIDRNLYDIFVVGVYSTLTGMWAIKCLKKEKIPYVLNCDGGFVPEKETYVKHRLKQYLIGGASYWLSTGKIGDQYLKHYGANESNIYHYHFSSITDDEVLTEVIKREDKRVYRDKLGMSGKRIVVSAGQFIFRKGYDILLKVAKELPAEWDIYIIGGTAGEEYIKLLEELSLQNVHFVEFKTKEELREYYLAADCMVLPTREDIWALVVNEAMALGLPVVTTEKCGAGLEMIQENGKIVPVESVNELCSAIRDVINSKNWEKMSQRSLATARLYTIEKMAEEHGKIFDNIMQKQ